MPFYIRHRVTRKLVDVELVDTRLHGKPLYAPGKKLGYYTDDGPTVAPETKVYGPFATAAEAEASENAWVEDV